MFLDLYINDFFLNRLFFSIFVWLVYTDIVSSVSDKVYIYIYIYIYIESLMHDPIRE